MSDLMAPLALRAPRRFSLDTMRDGCSWLAALMALGRPPEAALERARRWLEVAIRGGAALGIGSGHGPVDHFHEGRR